MPTFRVTLRYTNDETGLEWTVRNFLTAADAVAAFALANAWNTAYMGVLNENIMIVDCKISDEAVMYDMYYAAAAAFTQRIGLLTNQTIPDSVCLLIRCYGSSINQGSSAWKLHGIDDSTISGDSVVLPSGPMTALGTASQLYFKQYRPVATTPTPPRTALPIVNPPGNFLRTVIMPTLYNRKLGRPFLYVGQQHAYLRTPAAP